MQTHIVCLKQELINVAWDSWQSIKREKDKILRGIIMNKTVTKAHMIWQIDSRMYEKYAATIQQ